MTGRFFLDGDHNIVANPFQKKIGFVVNVAPLFRTLERTSQGLVELLDPVVVEEQAERDFWDPAVSDTSYIHHELVNLVVNSFLFRKVGKFLIYTMNEAHAHIHIRSLSHTRTEQNQPTRTPRSTGG
jgi:hypothetical protein